MNKINNLKSDNFKDEELSIEQLEILKQQNLRRERKENFMTGLIFLIGVIGFVIVFILPQDLVYSKNSLENSFANPKSKLASNNSTTKTKSILPVAQNWDDLFTINGYPEVGELLEFRFEKFNAQTDVKYFINFGNTITKEIKDSSTTYHYPYGGKYKVRLIADYQGEQKEVCAKKIFIEDEIIVRSTALFEAN